MNRHTAIALAISSIFASLATAAAVGLAADSFALLALLGFALALPLVASL